MAVQTRPQVGPASARAGRDWLWLPKLALPASLVITAVLAAVLLSRRPRSAAISPRRSTTPGCSRLTALCCGTTTGTAGTWSAATACSSRRWPRSSAPACSARSRRWPLRRHECAARLSTARAPGPAVGRGVVRRRHPRAARRRPAALRHRRDPVGGRPARRRPEPPLACGGGRARRQPDQPAGRRLPVDGRARVGHRGRRTTGSAVGLGGDRRRGRVVAREAAATSRSR